MDKTVQHLVEGWLARDGAMFDACLEEPEAAWEAILALVRHDLTPEALARLAAGPLEHLLKAHGRTFIDRVERLAAEDDQFNHLLGGVWKSRMADDIWHRVQAARRVEW